MLLERIVQVHFLPEWVPEGRLSGATAVVVDVLRATTTILHALSAGCLSVRPCLEVEEARVLAGEMRAGRVLLGGERGGKPLPDFDLGNSPLEYTKQVCQHNTLVLTTTNGTRTLLRAAEAEQVWLAAFGNFSAVCEQLRDDARPTHILCAGSEGEVSMDDIILAGALVDFLCDVANVRLNDSARLAWDAFENHGSMLLEALELSQGGAVLRELGYDDDIRAAAEVDRFTFVPELRRDPLRVEIGVENIVAQHWMQ
jgi:2-phosphosulfolactate phosphatase